VCAAIPFYPCSFLSEEGVSRWVEDRRRREGGCESDPTLTLVWKWWWGAGRYKVKEEN
jgi:hypothetical protein